MALICKCDICGKEMSVGTFSRITKDFCISSHGKAWDICTECRNELNEWIKARKVESEDAISRNLCDFCMNNGCILQTGIIRNHCDFYIAKSEEE